MKSDLCPFVVFALGFSLMALFIHLFIAMHLGLPLPDFSQPHPLDHLANETPHEYTGQGKALYIDNEGFCDPILNINTITGTAYWVESENELCKEEE